ncbi:MAG: methylenetetrahydrofolate reductase C-terminal domain-containing protein [Syntrophaceae bacterium]|nr:methylenetetrahydrofolate reductase C-terminal domain-containing protein [Syntrophaceae bacterium]
MSPNRFREALLEKKQFVYTLELVPGRGAKGKILEEAMKIAEKAVKGNLIHALSITDNAGGHPALFPNVLGREICGMGMNPVIHFTCKDKNRNQIESILYALDRIGIENLLVMTGDYPLYGFEGKAKPVYDLDSIQLLHLIKTMNEGKCIDGKAPGGGAECLPTHFLKGCAVSPFKMQEEEVLAQYFKLCKKAKAGADFIITQVGYDARKFDEVLRFMRQQGIALPIIGNVYVLNRPVAKVMNRGDVPGCVVTDSLYRLIEEESRAPDKGKVARLTRAAKLVAVLKGIGYQGVHIGGPNLKYEDVEWLIEKSKEYSAAWDSLVREFSFPQEKGFYLYMEDAKTGLNTDVPNFKRIHPRKKWGYRFMRFLHHFMFVPGAPLFKTARCFFQKIDGSRAEIPFTELEYWIKFASSRCQRCGDCTLSEMAFLCPQSQCAKFLLNGQCGGSRDGWCEVFPGKKRCIYVRAYRRLRAYREEESMEDGYIPPRNWDLSGTSSWANYFLGRDHQGIKQ